jgi:hypothetical protein
MPMPSFTGAREAIGENGEEREPLPAKIVREHAPCLALFGRSARLRQSPQETSCTARGP